MKHLGSWTMFSDISGQVSRSPENPVMILAAVAVPNEVVEQVRHRLVARNPKKWKESALNGLQHVRFLIQTYRLPTCALSIYREPGSWAE